MRIKQCLGLNGEQCTEFSTTPSQLCEKHEKEVKEKIERIKNHEKQEA